MYWSQRTRGPTLFVTPCEREDPPPENAPIPNTFRWLAANSKYFRNDTLVQPSRAETRKERLELARRGLATGSYRMNCIETPFLVNERGINYVQRLELYGDNFKWPSGSATMEPPPAAPKTPPANLPESPTAESPVNPFALTPEEIEAIWVTPMKLARAQANAHSRERSRSLDIVISKPMRLQATVSKELIGSGALSRSLTFSSGLSEISRGPQREYFAEPPPSAFAPLATLGRKMAASLRGGLESSHAPSSFRERKKAGRVRARSLDEAKPAKKIGDENDAPALSSSVTVANVHAMRAARPKYATVSVAAGKHVPAPASKSVDLRGFSTSASLQSSGSLSKSLHQLSDQLSSSASNLRRMVLKSFNRHSAEISQS